ncbi:MAG: DUF2058 domain-containing protein [Steroidobacteraceae bacterium]
MSMSLRDQLLQAGLVNEKQAREAERQLEQRQQGQRQLPKQRRDAPSKAELAARQSQQAKAARDQELNRRQREEAQRKARVAQIKQLIEQHRLPQGHTDESYHFTDGNRVRHIPADAAMRARLSRGEVAIVRCEGRYELVPAETAARIRERDARLVIAIGGAARPATAPIEDDGYRDFEVPDDLMW